MHLTKKIINGHPTLLTPPPPEISVILILFVLKNFDGVQQLYFL